MKFGFHSYSQSFSERFSSKNIVYFVVFFGFVLLSVALMTSYSQQIPYISRAQDATISPIADNFSAPLTQSIKTDFKRKQVIGFLPSWSIAQNVRVYPEYLDQIIYFGIGMDSQGNLMRIAENGDPTIEWGYFRSEVFENIRVQADATNTKILVAIKNFDNEQIDTLISSDAHRQNAINQLVSLVTDYELDGINLDFEYFTDTDFPTLQYFNRFLTDLNTQLEKTHPDAIISIDVNASVIYQDNAYDMVRIGELVDQVIIMGYDYHRAPSEYAGPVAPIEAKGDDPSLKKSVNSLIGRVGREKIILGIPLYGYEWQTYTDKYASATVPQTGALATYKRVRELVANRTDITLDYDELSKSPRLVYKQNGLIKQIYYEDEKSLSDKIQFVEANELEGIALWALGYEGDYTEPWTLIKNHLRTSY